MAQDQSTPRDGETVSSWRAADPSFWESLDRKVIASLTGNVLSSFEHPLAEQTEIRIGPDGRVILEQPEVTSYRIDANGGLHPDTGYYQPHVTTAEGAIYTQKNPYEYVIGEHGDLHAAAHVVSLSSLRYGAVEWKTVEDLPADTYKNQYENYWRNLERGLVVAEGSEELAYGRFLKLIRRYRDSLQLGSGWGVSQVGVREDGSLYIKGADYSHHLSNYQTLTVPTEPYITSIIPPWLRWDRPTEPWMLMTDSVRFIFVYLVAVWSSLPVAPRSESSQNEVVETHDHAAWSLSASPARSMLNVARRAA